MEKNITVWALGGVGTKISHRLRKQAVVGDGITPTLEYVYIDTSDSEATLIPSSSDLDLVSNKSGLKGSGGDRGRNYEAANAQIPGIVSKRATPGNINFLIASTGAGSGSTLMYVTARQLIEQGEAVVCFVSNTTDSQTRTHNAVTSMTSMNNLAMKAGINIPAFIYDTVESSTFVENDEIMVGDILITAALLNETVVGVDDMDRRVALNPCMAGQQGIVEPGLKAATLFEGTQYEGSSPIISALTLVEPGQSDNIGTGAPLIFGGTLSKELKNMHLNNNDNSAISLLLNDTALSSWTEEMNSRLDSQIKSRSSAFRGDEIKVSDKTIVREIDDSFVC